MNLQVLIDIANKHNTELENVVAYYLTYIEPTKVKLLIEPEESYESDFKDSTTLFNELRDTFPKFIEIQGKQIPAIVGGDVDGKYIGNDRMEQLYAEKIAHSLTKHNDIIRKLKLAKEKNLINFVLRKFILDELWILFDDIDNQEIEKAL